MKEGDFVYCKKDFYRVKEDNENELLNYPKHAFYIGEKYRIFDLEQQVYPLSILSYTIEIDEVYIEKFVRHNDFLKETDFNNNTNYTFEDYDFDEYFFDNIKEFRKFKLKKLNKF